MMFSVEIMSWPHKHLGILNLELAKGGKAYGAKGLVHLKPNIICFFHYVKIFHIFEEKKYLCILKQIVWESRK